MARPRQPDPTSEILSILATRSSGATAAELRSLLRSHPSQPTLSRRLTELRASGEVVVVGRGPATRYQIATGSDLSRLRSRLLHEAVAMKLLRRPDLVDRATNRLALLRKSNPSARRHHDRWRDLLAGPRTALLRAMTENSDSASDLRKESPMTVLLDPKERERALSQLSR